MGLAQVSLYTFLTVLENRHGAGCISRRRNEGRDNELNACGANRILFVTNSLVCFFLLQFIFLFSKSYSSWFIPLPLSSPGWSYVWKHVDALTCTKHNRTDPLNSCVGILTSLIGWTWVTAPSWYDILVYADNIRYLQTPVHSIRTQNKCLPGCK